MKMVCQKPQFHNSRAAKLWFTALRNLNLNGFVNRGLYAMLSQANKGMAKWYVTKVGMSPGTRGQNQLSTLHLRGTLAEVLV